MSIFASRTQKTVAIPFDEPHTVTIMKLAGRHLAKAREEMQIAAADGLRRMGGAAFQRELQALAKEEVGPAAAASDALALDAVVDPLNLYDRFVVLHRGVKAWSYVDDQNRPLPVTPEAIDDLSDEAAEFIAREILALTLPARDEAGRKNG